MKKIILGITLLLLTSISFGQVKREKLIDEKIGKISFRYAKSTDLEKNEIIYFVYLGFQNEKYTSITDIKSVSFFDKESLNEFIKDLNAAKTQMLLKQKTDLSWNRKKYNLAFYDFSFDLYLKQATGTEAYTTLDEKTVDKLIEVLMKIDFGKDALLTTSN